MSCLVQVIAHRGYSSRAPENTLASFDLALASGYPHIEFDVHLTSDAIPVVIHDATVARTTNGRGRVDSMNLERVKQLNAGEWFDRANRGGLYARERVPTLEEILKRYAGAAHLYIELKSEEPELPVIVAELLSKNFWLTDNNSDNCAVPGVTIISFDLEQLRRSKRILAGVPHGYLCKNLDSTSLDMCLYNNIEGLFPFIKSLNHESVKAAHLAGLVVGTWGASEPKDILPAVNMGVLGVTVDWPDAAKDILKSVN